MSDPRQSMRDLAQDIIDNPRRGAHASIRNGRVTISLGFSREELTEMHGPCGRCNEPRCWCNCVSAEGHDTA